MRRDLLASLGIQLPVLPTIVLGGLPGAPNWAVRLERIGLDVVASGAADDTEETYVAARTAVPHRPCLVEATGVGGRLLPDGWRGTVYDLADDPVVAFSGRDWPGDGNDVARAILDTASADPSMWWVAANELATLDATTADALLTTLVEGVRHVRLYLAKQQVD